MSEIFVQYGGGNIGRGFIGPLFAAAGYHVCFVDVNTALIEAINLRKSYTQAVVSDDGEREYTVTNISGVDGRNTAAAARAVADAAVMATAVGVNVLPLIATVLAEGFRLRMIEGRPKLDVIICENLLHANKYFRDLVAELLDPEEKAWMDLNVGFVEASIGRMVPVMTEEMQRGDLLRVCVEPYAELPVDAEAIRGELPQCPQIHPFTPFEFYILRKLYLHNMSHSLVAYLGMREGYTAISASVEDPLIKLFATRAMNESKQALALRFGTDRRALDEHADDLLLRFANRALGDTAARVGRDTKRKLSPGDRYAGAIGLCIEQQVLPVYICTGAAAALFFEDKDDVASMEIRSILRRDGFDGVVCGHMGLQKDGDAYRMMNAYYRLLASGGSLRELLHLCEDYRKKELSAKVVI